MPEEPEAQEAESEHTQAYKDAVDELYEFYASTDREEWGAHREEVGKIKERMQADGATPEEVEVLSEDFAREIEDVVENLQKSAQEFVHETIRERPALASRPDAVVKIVARKLREIAPSPVSKETLRIVAQRMVDAILPG